MSAYDRIVRQTFRALVPGHALFITPGAQPATGHDDAGLHVHFPTTNELATAHFGQLWPPLTQPLKYQLISYLAGHEAMHAWEMVRGYRAHPANTLRGLVANILADIRIDHSPVLRTLAHWPLNRDIAYRVLDEPLIPPADLEPAELPHHNALRVLNWGLAMLRCGRLRQSDGTTVQAPTHPLYAQLWPQVLAIMIEARNYNWHTETDLLDRLLDLLRGWTRHQPPPTPADDNSTPDTANTAIVDAEHPDTTEAADAHNPFHWQDEQDQPPDHTDFDQQLHDALSQVPDPRGCTGTHDSQQQEGNSWTPEDAVQEITDSPLREQAEADWEQHQQEAQAEAEQAAQQARRNHPAAALTEDTLAKRELLPAEWFPHQPRAHFHDNVTGDTQLIPPLATQLETVLRPLLTGSARRQRPHTSGSRLDLHHQATRVYVQAAHGGERDPNIWLDHRMGQGRNRLALALVVDCSGSMLSHAPAPAKACHITTAGLLRAIDALGRHADLALAGFTDEVLTIRGFDDTLSTDRAEQLLTLAQSVCGGTAVAPAVAWGLSQLDNHRPGHRDRRMLAILTDAVLGDADRQHTQQRLTAAPGDIITIAIGLGSVDAAELRQLTPNTLILPADRTPQLPGLLQHAIEKQLHA
ncbi:VWA domain-containing protein [Crossiella sp. CA-258035]|uniref:vWA domain-containing protein n=1 Tax=Crossiella sp. CA-258035 TaxID=2981138 RepID=UPI0024BD0528|nr:vWA domain-containing protein [Crossiella sp. CA-258035]WHT22532.1 VWA domain-containing protein [Crossiella sp. CA-258035]